MQLAVPVVRRFDRQRRSLLEKQQHLTYARLHRATTLAEFADDAKAKGLAVETHSARNIVYVQRGLKNPVDFWRHRNHSSKALDGVSQKWKESTTLIAVKV